VGRRHTAAVPTSAHAIAALLALRHGQQVEEVLATVEQTVAHLGTLHIDLAAIARDEPLLVPTTRVDQARGGATRQAHPSAALAVALTALERAGAGGGEVISVYRSAGAIARDAAATSREHGPTALLADTLRAAFPGVEVQVLDGAQEGAGYLLTWE
jgi:hypothetical protein